MLLSIPAIYTLTPYADSMDTKDASLPYQDILVSCTALYRWIYKYYRRRDDPICIQVCREWIAVYPGAIEKREADL